jgi:hypothetical protein
MNTGIGKLSTYIPTIDTFLSHWQQCLTAYAPKVLIIRLPDNKPVLRSDLVGLRDTLQAQQITVQARLTDQLVARGAIENQKAALLAKFSLFNCLLDGYYQNTDFYAARPLAPSQGFGQLTFSIPMFDAMSLWKKLDEAPAPVGLTLPLALSDGTLQGDFASLVSALQFAYAAERSKGQDVTLARSTRNRLQSRAYAIMKAYREAVPGKMGGFPELVETLPRLTPLPGHTPSAVNASAVLDGSNQARVVYDASDDSSLESYQLRGNVGEEYSDEDAIVIATNSPGAAREFITPFGLTQPGAKVALKVFVVLTTGNEAGSAPMLVQRPLSLPLAA